MCRSPTLSLLGGLGWILRANLKFFENFLNLTV